MPIAKSRATAKVKSDIKNVIKIAIGEVKKRKQRRRRRKQPPQPPQPPQTVFPSTVGNFLTGVSPSPIYPYQILRDQQREASRDQPILRTLQQLVETVSRPQPPPNVVVNVPPAEVPVKRERGRGIRIRDVRRRRDESERVIGEQNLLFSSGDGRRPEFGVESLSGAMEFPGLEDLPVVRTQTGEESLRLTEEESSVASATSPSPPVEGSGGFGGEQVIQEPMGTPLPPPEESEAQQALLNVSSMRTADIPQERQPGLESSPVPRTPSLSSAVAGGGGATPQRPSRPAPEPPGEDYSKLKWSDLKKTFPVFDNFGQSREKKLVFKDPIRSSDPPETKERKKRERIGFIQRAVESIGGLEKFENRFGSKLSSEVETSYKEYKSSVS